mgnify:CR=1 FL=1
MDAAVKHLDHAFQRIRAGRASTTMVQDVMVEYYGAPTPLNQVANVSIPDAMTISIQPWDRTAINAIEKAIINSNLGFAPSNNGENIILNATLLGLRRKDIMAKLPKIIEFSELGDFIDEPIRVYSSGMLAKLGFSVISQVEPEILIIDEVLAVGDIAFQKKCTDTINDFKKKGVTILLVSHNMKDVKSICDKVIWIENHHLREIGDPETIATKYLDLMINE